MTELWGILNSLKRFKKYLLFGGNDTHLITFKSGRELKETQKDNVKMKTFY